MGCTTDEFSDRLHAEAIAATDLDDFGDPGYLDGLHHLLEALGRIAGLDDDGVGSLATILAGMPLVARLRTEAAWRAHESCLDTSLIAPVFIVGMPRTGTTALHQMLSTDDRFQAAEKWLHSHPQPRPPREAWDDHPGYQEVVAMDDALPDSIKRTHLVRADEADECLIPMAQSFVSNLFGSQVPIPTYDEWFLAQDMVPSFERYSNFLRLLGSTSPGRTWLLKNPSHVLCLDELFTVFPDARVIQTHRDPQVALGSVVSLLGAIGKMIGHERSPHDIARREVALWGEGMRRAAAARRNHEAAFCDVDYRQFAADPVSVVQEIYRAVDMDFADETEQAMRQWADDHSQVESGAHVYNSDELGVDRAAVEEQLGDYIKEYDLW